MNYLILCIIIVLLSYNLFKKPIEPFQSVTESPLELHDDIYEPGTLNSLNYDMTLFNDFCSKIKHINNNYNDNSRQLLRLSNIHMNQLNLKKKESNKLLQDILDLQETIYTNEEELQYRKNYESQSNKKVEKQLKIITTVIDNIKNNKDYQNKLFLNIN